MAKEKNLEFWTKQLSDKLAKDTQQLIDKVKTFIKRSRGEQMKKKKVPKELIIYVDHQCW